MPPRRGTRTWTTARKSTPIPLTKSTIKSAANGSQETLSSTTTTSSPAIETTSKTSPKIIPNSTANASVQDSTEVLMVEPSETAIETEKSTQETATTASKSTQETVSRTEHKAAPIDEKITVTNPNVGEHVTAPSETSSENTTVKSPRVSEILDAMDSLQAGIAASTAVVRENVDGSGQETATEAVSKTGGKTVLKKTVRVVKKLVKKKVPKRVQKDLALLLNQETEEKAGMPKDCENPNPNVLVGTEVENPNSVESVSMEVDNPDSHVSIPEKPEACEGEHDASLTQNLSGAPDSVATKNNQSKKTLSVTETQLDDESPIQDPTDECETENVDSRGGEEEVENCEVSCLKEEVRTGDVVLSGEMEALERRRKRKTEIFIGGLDKDAKEEDIRKILEEVGAIVEVRLKMNGKTGKNKGFAFVRFASAADAKNALEKYPKVEVCGKQCSTSLVEGNDTIFLGNIDKHWKSEDVLKLLQEIGIEKIDKVTVMADPNKIECNRGFAFLELETCKDAQNAYKQLQKKVVFGKHRKIKVAWAEPLKEPDEEEMLKVKSVYAEYIPSSWNEENMRNYFKKFGEIEDVVLARNLSSSKRKDFAFVNYTMREAALACIEAFRRDSFNDDGSKVNVKVSLAKPIPKGKEIKPVSNPISKESSKVKLKVAQSVTRPHEPRNKRKSSSSGYKNVRIDKSSSTTAELVQLLREQASWKQSQTSLGTGSLDRDYPNPSSGRKRPFTGDDSLYSDLGGYPRTRLESSFPITSLSYTGLSQGVGATSLPYYHQQGADYASGSFDGIKDYTSYQTRGAPYGGSSSLYHRFR